MNVIVYKNDTIVKEGEMPVYVRIRREQPELSTFTVKTGSHKFPTERELELTPVQANTLEEMMRDMGQVVKYKVEKIRELWTIPDMPSVKEIVFDEYPGLPMYMEVDAHTKEALKEAVKMLKLKDSDRIPERTDGYKHFYGIPTAAEGRVIPPGASLTFDSGAKAQFTQYLDEERSAKFDAVLAEQIPRAKKLRIMHT